MWVAMWPIGDNTVRVCQGMTRRGFLQLGVLWAMVRSLPQILAAQEANRAGKKRQQAVILVWLWGGPSHLDTFDMKPEAPLAYRGPFRAVGTNVPGIQVCEYLPF